MPELTSILFGMNAFTFKDDDDSSELIMRSGDDEMKAIHDTKNKTTIYRDETFFEKTFARG